MSSKAIALFALVLTSACGGGDDTDQPVSTTTADGTTTTTDTTTTTTTIDTGPTGEIFDCATISDVPLSITEMPESYGYHDVDFDIDGNLMGYRQNGNIMGKTSYSGDFQVFMSQTGTVQGMAQLPNGELAYASDTQGIMRVGASGSPTLINGNYHPYGLILGPDDYLYAAVEFDGIYRIDYTTGQAQRLQINLPNGSPRVINFNLDYTKMYIGTRNGNGNIYAVDLDADLNPIGGPVTFATGIGAGNYHDTLGVDLCGNLYVSDYDRRKLWRIAPDGTNFVFLDSSNGGGGIFSSQHIHGMEWGHGIGGWREDAIYVSKPYDQGKVSEIVIGVPSKDWDKGYAINLPTP